MARSTTYLVLSLIAASAVAISGCSSRPEPTEVAESVVFAAADMDDPNNPKEFRFSLEGAEYRISWKGKGTVVARNRLIPPFSLGLRWGHSLERLKYGSYRGNIVLYYQLNNVTSRSSWVARIHPGTGKAVWATEVNGFNIGTPLAVGGKLYLTASGLVGKVDLETGKYDWVVSGLFKGRAFESFRKPWVSGGQVVFVDDNDDDNAYVLVDSATGRLEDLVR